MLDACHYMFEEINIILVICYWIQGDSLYYVIIQVCKFSWLFMYWCFMLLRENVDHAVWVCDIDFVPFIYNFYVYKWKEKLILYHFYLLQDRDRITGLEFKERNRIKSEQFRGTCDLEPHSSLSHQLSLPTKLCTWFADSLWKHI